MAVNIYKTRLFSIKSSQLCFSQALRTAFALLPKILETVEFTFSGLKEIAWKHSVMLIKQFHTAQLGGPRSSQSLQGCFIAMWGLSLTDCHCRSRGLMFMLFTDLATLSSPVSTSPGIRKLIT